MKNLMKFTLTLVGLLFISQMLSAQAVGKGAWMVGGSAGFTSTSYKDVDGSQTVISVAPNLGYFIADDLAIGLALNLTNTSPLVGDSFTEFGLGPFVRFYFADAIFAQAGLNLGLGDNEFTEFQVGVGYSWFLEDGVAVEPMLFYRSHSVDDPGVDSSIIGLSIGVQAFAHHEHGMD
jgi:hypothetical protein